MPRRLTKKIRYIASAVWYLHGFPGRRVTVLTINITMAICSGINTVVYSKSFSSSNLLTSSDYKDT